MRNNKRHEVGGQQMPAAMEIVDQAIVRQTALPAKRIEPFEKRMPVPDDAIRIDRCHGRFACCCQSAAPIGIVVRRKALGRGKAMHDRAEVCACCASKCRSDIIAIRIARLSQQVLQLLQRVAENPAIGRAVPILRIERRIDLLADQHGKHVDGEGVPKRVRRHIDVDAEAVAAGASPAKSRFPSG